jgi:hypothetical protein
MKKTLFKSEYFPDEDWKFLADTYELYVGEKPTRERVLFILNRDNPAFPDEELNDHLRAKLLEHAHEHGLINEKIKWEFICQFKRLVFDETGIMPMRPELNSMWERKLEMEKTPHIINEEYEQAQVIQDKIDELGEKTRKAKEEEAKIRGRNG